MKQIKVESKDKNGRWVEGIIDGKETVLSDGVDVT